MSGDENINRIGDVSGSNISITQVYAPGGLSLRPQTFVRAQAVVPLSIEWLVFSQQSIPFIGRQEERAALAKFLEQPEPFSWWAIVGSGGCGKSRLALEVAQHLPEGWTGGFVPRENCSLRDCAAWQPTSHTVWIIDDAASLGPELGRIISAWAGIHGGSKYKVRLIVLERGFSGDAGWWEQLTGLPSPETVAVKRTLFRPPLTIAPLRNHADAFLGTLCDLLEESKSARLRSAIMKIGQDHIFEQSQGGNPLLLQLISAELLTAKDPTNANRNLSPRIIVNGYLERELDRLKARCDDAGVRFTAMLDLLFITTSCFPIPLALDHDLIFAHHDGKVVLLRNKEGKLDPPTAAQLRGMGVDVNCQVLETLSSMLGVDDPNAYLSVLAEIGLDRTRYAIQPDLIAAALLSLMLNSPETPTSLKRRRGEFDREKTMRLIEGAYALSSVAASAAWARLSDNAILTLVSYSRLHGKSIRYPLLLIRGLNARRSAKVPFDADMIFAPNNAHPEAPDVGRYFADVRAALVQERLEADRVAYFAESPHSWVLPYIHYLLDISLLEEARLGYLICSIQSKTTLSRLTNLTNFLFCVQRTLSMSFPHPQHRSLTDAERAELARLIERLLYFVRFQAWPAIISADDRTYTEMYLILARALIVSSYAIGNQMRGHKEDSEARRQAIAGLAIARVALEVASSPEDLVFLDRNQALLETAETLDPNAVAEVYFKAFDAIATYAKPAAFTGIIEDFLLVCKSRKMPQLLDALLTRLVRTPQQLIVPEQIIYSVFEQLLELQDSGQGELLKRLIVPYCTFFSEMLQHTEAQESADDFGQMITLASNVSQRDEQTLRGLLSLLQHLRAVLDQASCSALFVTAVLKGAQVTQFSLRRQGDVTGLIPFETTSRIFAGEELEQFVQDESDHVRLRTFESVTMVWTSYRSPNGEVQASFMGFYPALSNINAGNYAELQPFAQVICDRIRQKYADAASITAEED